jgi:hypothetical protein
VFPAFTYLGKMKAVSYRPFLPVLLALATFGCSDKNEDPKPSRQLVLLTIPKWRLSAATEVGVVNWQSTMVDLYASLPVANATTF